MAEGASPATPGPAPVAMVTGGSRGIGRGICLELARQGFAVAVNYAGNETAARETEALVGNAEKTLLCQGDMALTADRERFVEHTLRQWGRIDVLVNNAGITSLGRRDLLDATEESWDRVLAVNLKGPYFLSQRVAREMIRLRPFLTNPCIVNINSLSSSTVSSNRGDYCISKAGLAMATKLFAVRLAEHAIAVHEICAGIIATDMTAPVEDQYDQRIRGGLTPIRRWGTPADIGQAVGLLVSGKLPFSTGISLAVDGGFHVRTL